MSLRSPALPFEEDSESDAPVPVLPYSDDRFEKLNLLLEKTAIYSQFLSERLAEDTEKLSATTAQPQPPAAAATTATTTTTTTGAASSSKKRKRKEAPSAEEVFFCDTTAPPSHHRTTIA